ncbi:hypothetical protein NC651_019007 [Populus alba x Populus x berolinensis]|nr:hypothetical protein NC651_019007 [Populus alba x Populus x berolinensis]
MSCAQLQLWLFFTSYFVPYPGHTRGRVIRKSRYQK